jgi:hypothetical protein
MSGIHEDSLNARRDHIDTVVSLLEMVADGQMPATSALAKWPDIDRETDRLIATAWHDLSHFATDDDIRRRDGAYDRYQRDLLKERARRIREKHPRAP